MLIARHAQSGRVFSALVRYRPRSMLVRWFLLKQTASCANHLTAFSVRLGRSPVWDPFAAGLSPLVANAFSTSADRRRSQPLFGGGGKTVGR